MEREKPGGYQKVTTYDFLIKNHLFMNLVLQKINLLISKRIASILEDIFEKYIKTSEEITTVGAVNIAKNYKNYKTKKGKK